MFTDRVEAGQALAEMLRERSVHWNDALVLGVPRGGVVVAYEVAHALGLPLDVVIASKIGAPHNPEYAVGAVAPDGTVSPNHLAGYSMEELRALSAPVHARVDARLAAFRAGGACPQVEGRTAVLIDDGIATGLTVHAAADYLRRCGADEIVLAVPVMPGSLVDEASEWAEEVVTLEAPKVFHAVGQFYRDFAQTTDDEVLRLLAEARESHRGGTHD